MSVAVGKPANPRIGTRKQVAQRLEMPFKSVVTTNGFLPDARTYCPQIVEHPIIIKSSVIRKSVYWSIYFS
jgi:hypothetical protein